MKKSNNKLLCLVVLIVVLLIICCYRKNRVEEFKKIKTKKTKKIKKIKTKKLKPLWFQEPKTTNLQQSQEAEALRVARATQGQMQTQTQIDAAAAQALAVDKELNSQPDPQLAQALNASQAGANLSGTIATEPQNATTTSTVGLVDLGSTCSNIGDASACNLNGYCEWNNNSNSCVMKSRN